MLGRGKIWQLPFCRYKISDGGLHSFYVVENNEFAEEKRRIQAGACRTIIYRQATHGNQGFIEEIIKVQQPEMQYPRVIQPNLLIPTLKK